jgi:hypothetical protein
MIYFFVFLSPSQVLSFSPAFFILQTCVSLRGRRGNLKKVVKKDDF